MTDETTTVVVKSRHLERDGDTAMGESEYPTVEYILEHWLTTADVAEMHGLTIHNITYLCREERLRSKLIAGRWFIDPQSARDYEPGQTGPKPDRPED